MSFNLSSPRGSEVAVDGRATIKRREKEDADFPRPVVLSTNRIAYKATDIARYMEAMQGRTVLRPVVADAAQEGGRKRGAQRTAEAAGDARPKLPH